MGSSKKVTVGYRYFLGMHLILCHGPVDRLTRITVDKKTAWDGEVSSGQIYVNAQDLFGGESREGGVSGAVDFESGAPEQARNSYLMSKLGSSISAYRGVAAAVLRQVYVGINPYLKAWSFRVQRIHTRVGGETQWYDEKSEVAVLGDVNLVRDATWEYVVTSAEANPGGSGFLPPVSGWSSGSAPFGHHDAGDPNIGDGHNTDWPTGTVLWVRRTVHLVANTYLRLNILAENGCLVFIDGVLSAAVNSSNSEPPEEYSGYVTVGPFPDTRDAELLIKAFDEASPGNNTYLSVIGQNVGSNDMNPAHIIRECLTDQEWGMGYLESDVDDASFTAAADQLYSEGFGISILWDRQTTIEDFVKEIVRHINAALYVDRTSGKFVLKLVRNDYDPETLLVLGEAQVEKVENFSRTAFGDMVNAVTVNYVDSVSGATASLTAQDTALIQMQGAVVGTTIQYPGISQGALAARVASRDLTTLSTPLLSCTIYADRTAASLNIGDVFKLDWPDLLAEPVVMRVMSLAFGDGRSNQVKVVASEDVFALPEVAVIVPQPPEWTDPTSKPEPAERHVAQEAPYFEMVQRMGQSAVDAALATEPDSGYVIAAASRPGSAINARLAVDSGAGYADNDVALDFCASATLSAAVNRTATTLPLADVVDGTLVEVGTHALLGGVEEVYVTAVDPDLLSVTVRRGVLDTIPIAHDAGALLMFWDVYSDGDGQEYVAGESIDVKVLPVTGSGELALASADTDTVVMDSRAIRPYPPANVTIGGVMHPTEGFVLDTEVAWARRNRAQQTGSDLLGWYDGDVTPEVGQAVSLRVKAADDSFTTYSQDDLTGTAHTVPASAFTYPDMAIEAWSTRDGYPSRQVYRCEFSVELGFSPDTMWDYVLSRATFDGADASTSLGMQRAGLWSVSGNAALTTAQKKFGTASLALDGSGDFVTLSHGFAFRVDRPFNVSVWARFTGTLGSRIYTVWRTANSTVTLRSHMFYLDSDSHAKVLIYPNSSPAGTYIDLGAPAAAILADGAFHLCEIDFDGTTLRAFLDGVLYGGVAISPDSPAVELPFALGRDLSNTARDWAGQLDDLRYTAASRHTASYTPSTDALPTRGVQWGIDDVRLGRLHLYGASSWGYSLSGSLISSALDLGWSSPVATAGGSTRPTYVAPALNAQPAARFSGAQYLTVSPSSIMASQNRGVTMAVVFRKAALDPAFTGVRMAMLAIGTSTTTYAFLGIGDQADASGNNKLLVGGRRVNANSFTSVMAPTPLADTDWHMAVGRINYATGAIDLFVDGSLVASLSSSLIGTSDSAASTAFIGAGVGGGTPFTGDLADVYAVDAALSDSDVDRVFGGLAYRYGLTGLLPSGHPYKSTPPDY